MAGRQYLPKRKMFALPFLIFVRTKFQNNPARQSQAAQPTTICIAALPYNSYSAASINVVVGIKRRSSSLKLLFFLLTKTSTIGMSPNIANIYGLFHFHKSLKKMKNTLGHQGKANKVWKFTERKLSFYKPFISHFLLIDNFSFLINFWMW